MNKTNITIYLFNADIAHPLCYQTTWGELSEGIPETAYMTNVNGKWYLEYDTDYGTIRVVDVEDECLSRDYNTLIEQVARHFGIHHTHTRTPSGGVEVTLQQIGNFREVVRRVDYDVLMRDICYNKHYRRFALINPDLPAFYHVALIDGQEPDIDPDAVRQEDVIISSYPKLYKPD